MYTNDITALFCFVDDFIKSVSANADVPRIASYNRISRSGPKPRLRLSEVVTIILFYHTSNYDCFKHYYQKKILVEHCRDFNLVSYQQFVKLIPLAMPIILYIMCSLFKQCTGTSFVDSTSIEVCKAYRINRHKTFSGLARRSKTTKGWFFGFKLHLLISPTGDLVKARFTPGNTDDRKALEKMTDGLFGKIFGDRGYIGKEFAARLYAQGLQVVTRIKKGMKNILMDLDDKTTLLRRSLIETVIGKIKLLGKFEHSRHRSVQNAFTHMMSCLINYQLQDDKPSILSLLT
jgi:Transposase DDE domain